MNTEAVTAHDDGDRRWPAETWIPDLIGVGVRAGASVYPDSAIAGMDMQSIEEELSSIDERYEFRGFATAAAAREWLASQ